MQRQGGRRPLCNTPSPQDLPTKFRIRVPIFLDNGRPCKIGCKFPPKYGKLYGTGEYGDFYHRKPHSEKERVIIWADDDLLADSFEINIDSKHDLLRMSMV